MIYNVLAHWQITLIHINISAPSSSKMPATIMILCFQTDMPGQTGSALFAILSTSFRLITLWYSHIVQVLE